MAKNKKLSGTQKTLNKTLNKMTVERNKIKQQREDALGFSANGEGVKKRLTYKALIKIKLVLVILFPIVFFIYSPLLFPLIVLYAATFFIGKKMENSANAGLKKSLWIKIPRIDSIIAIALMAIVIFGLIITITTTTYKPSMYEGKTQSQVEKILKDKGAPSDSIKELANSIVSDGLTRTRGEKYLLQAGTMFTGERVFFISKNGGIFGFGNSKGNETGNKNGNNNGGGVGVIKGDDDKPIIVAEYGASLSDIPFVNVFVQIIVVLNVIIVAGIFVSGIFTIRRMKRFKLD